jgi:hypothetical protein
MTRNHDHQEFGPNATLPERTPRLRLKAKAPQTGYVDGAWWPHTDSLTAELPDLLAVLSVRLGPIDRVLYNVGEWGTAPRGLAFGGRAVRLDGYQNQPPNSVEILGLDRSRITLLVVPPSAGPDDAHTTMMAAAAAQNASTVSDLLRINVPDTPNRSQSAGPEQVRWESDGGSSRQPALSAPSGKATE